jgi:hypothetical protein
MNYNIYSQKGLEKNAENRGSKVFVKMKKGQKKCPFFENGNESWKTLFFGAFLAQCSKLRIKS